jgi:hypothetical protein
MLSSHKPSPPSCCSRLTCLVRKQCPKLPRNRARVAQIDGRNPDAAGIKACVGDLLVESVYRYKGQSAPAVVVAEFDFEELDEAARRRLFVALTRAQMAAELVLSARAEQRLAATLGQDPQARTGLAGLGVLVDEKNGHRPRRAVESHQAKPLEDRKNVSDLALGTAGPGSHAQRASLRNVIARLDRAWMLPTMPMAGQVI